MIPVEVADLHPDDAFPGAVLRGALPVVEHVVRTNPRPARESFCLLSALALMAVLREAGIEHEPRTGKMIECNGAAPLIGDSMFRSDTGHCWIALADGVILDGLRSAHGARLTAGTAAERRQVFMARPPRDVFTRWEREVATLQRTITIVDDLPPPARAA
jgi:hypothetical protein